MRLIDADRMKVDLLTVDPRYETMVYWCLTVLDAQPTVEPQRIRARWVQISPAKIYECSLCGKNVMTEDIDAYDFCHGCGADMRGEQG